MTHTDSETPDVRVPILAVVGRPNVGKSTLVNRIIGRREAVVEDVPGVTRDRVSYDAHWNGRAFTVVDTGGWDPDARGLAASISAQAEIAVTIADAVLFVVDAGVGITDSDEAVARILRKADKPSCSRPTRSRPARRCRGRRPGNLGPGEPLPVSGSTAAARAMLDAVLAALPDPAGVLRAAAAAPAVSRRSGVRCRQALAARRAGRRDRCGRRRRVGHHRRPGRRADRAGWRNWRFIETAAPKVR